MARYSKGCPEYLAQLDKLKRLHIAKSSDYGAQTDPLANLKECTRIGVPASTGSFIRLTDKFARTSNLMDGRNPANVNESLEDSLLDLAGYAILTIVLLKQEAAALAPPVVEEAPVEVKKKRRRRRKNKSVEEKTTLVDQLKGRLVDPTNTPTVRRRRKKISVTAIDKANDDGEQADDNNE